MRSLSVSPNKRTHHSQNMKPVMKCLQGITVQTHLLCYYPGLWTPPLQSAHNHNFCWPPGIALCLALTTLKLRYFIPCIALVNDKILSFLYLPHKWQDIALFTLVSKRQDVLIITCFLSLSLYLTQDSNCLHCNNQSHRYTKVLLCSVCYFCSVSIKSGKYQLILIKKPKYEMSQIFFQSESSHSVQRDE
jgi:hypothetical protein